MVNWIILTILIIILVIIIYIECKEIIRLFEIDHKISSEECKIGDSKSHQIVDAGTPIRRSHSSHQIVDAGTSIRRSHSSHQIVDAGTSIRRSHSSHQIVEYYENNPNITKQKYKSMYNIDDNKLKQGLYINFYNNISNSICEEYFYVNDVKNGHYVKKYENGNIKYIANFNNGKLNGKSTRFFASGNKQCVCHHVNDVYHGLYIQYNEKGDIVKQILFDNGIKKIDV